MARIYLGDTEITPITPTIESKTITNRNVGDIFYTTRRDNGLLGAVECNGAEYNIADVNGGDNNIQSLLVNGALPHKSYSEWQAIVDRDGGCDSFAWDRGGTFRVPKVDGRILVRRKKPTGADPTWFNVYSDGWCEQGGSVAPNSTAGITVTLAITMADTNYALAGLAEAVDTGAACTASYKNKTTTGFQANGARATATAFAQGSGTNYYVIEGYAAPSEYTRDKWEYQDAQVQRPMVQLFSGAADEALATATEALADIAAIKNTLDSVAGRFLVRKKEATADDPSWYNVYSDGWCEQGAIITETGFNVRISFAISMLPNVMYDVNISHKQPGAYASDTSSATRDAVVCRAPVYNRPDSSGFYVSFCSASVGDGTNWRVTGYADPSEYAIDKWTVRPSATSVWLPMAPTANGTYSLGLNIQDGTPTPFWGQSFVRPPSAPERYLVRCKKPTPADPTWFNVYSNGWCEQGGVVAKADSDNNNITYPILMRDTNYTILSLAENLGSTTVVSRQLFAKREHLCNIFNSAGEHNAFDWLVMGYANPTEYTNDKWGDDTDYSQISVMTGDPSPFALKAWTNSGGETLYTTAAVPTVASMAQTLSGDEQNPITSVGIVRGDRGICVNGENDTFNPLTAYARNQALDTNDGEVGDEPSKELTWDDVLPGDDSEFIYKAWQRDDGKIFFTKSVKNIDGVELYDGTTEEEGDTEIIIGAEGQIIDGKRAFIYEGQTYTRYPAEDTNSFVKLSLDFGSVGTTQQELPAGTYDVWAVGGGSGAALLANLSSKSKHYAQGGVGGVIHAQITLPQTTTVTVTVGSGAMSGNKNFTGGGTTQTGNTGTASSVTFGDNSIIAGAGTPGSVTSTSGSASNRTAGKQGTNSATGPNILKIIENNQNTITSQEGTSTASSRTPAYVLNTNWSENTARGQGGDVGWSSDTAFQNRSGGSGFVRITAATSAGGGTVDSSWDGNFPGDDSEYPFKAWYYEDYGGHFYTKSSKPSIGDSIYTVSPYSPPIEDRDSLDNVLVAEIAYNEDTLLNAVKTVRIVDDNREMHVMELEEMAEDENWLIRAPEYDTNGVETAPSYWDDMMFPGDNSGAALKAWTNKSGTVYTRTVNPEAIDDVFESPRPINGRAMGMATRIIDGKRAFYPTPDWPLGMPAAFDPTIPDSEFYIRDPERDEGLGDLPLV